MSAKARKPPDETPTERELKFAQVDLDATRQRLDQGLQFQEQVDPGLAPPLAPAALERRSEHRIRRLELGADTVGEREELAHRRLSATAAHLPSNRRNQSQSNENRSALHIRDHAWSNRRHDRCRIRAGQRAAQPVPRQRTALGELQYHAHHAPRTERDDHARPHDGPRHLRRHAIRQQT